MTSLSFQSSGSGSFRGSSVGAIPGVPEQNFLGDRGNVPTRKVENVPDRQSAASDEAVAREVVEVPLIGTHRPVEPDRVVEAGCEQDAVAEFLGFGADGMGADDRVGRQVVGEVGKGGEVLELSLIHI